jgi:predicted PurR-regulated permease PerM
MLLGMKVPISLLKSSTRLVCQTIRSAAFYIAEKDHCQLFPLPSGLKFVRIIENCQSMKQILERVNQNLLFAILLGVILWFGKPVLVPLLLGALLAMLMAPVCRSLDDKGLSRAVSCAICILILLVVILGILYIVIAQINSFTENITQLERKTRELLLQLQVFVENHFNIDKKDQEVIVEEQVQGGEGTEGGFTSVLVSGFTSTLTTMVLMLVYTFLFLYSKEKFETFFVRLYHDEDTDKVKNIVAKISMVAQNYLAGRAMSVIILACLYSVALLLIGLENALLLAGIAALLTIIPYVGSTVGGMFPFCMALITEETATPALMVAGSIMLIQTIDNYFIEPNVVGGEVNLSALASIMSIIIGGVIWGIAGMILFIPMVGILKIIFDHVESLKPLGYVIGDGNEKYPSKVKTWIREKLGIKEKDEPI